MRSGREQSRDKAPYEKGACAYAVGRFRLESSDKVPQVYLYGPDKIAAILSIR